MTKPGRRARSVEEIVAVTTDLRATKPTTPMSLRRANVLASLDIERQRADAARREHPREDLDRRLERIEAAIADLYQWIGVAA